MDQNNFSEDIPMWERIQNGDREAVSELFKKYYRPLLNYGLKLIPQEPLVKDSIQELFYSIWDQRQNLSEVEYVRSYLYISLRRTIYRQAEIKKTRNERDQDYAAAFFQNIVNDKQPMAQEKWEEDQKKKLKQSLEALGDKEKEAIFLKFYSGLSNAEIARVMEVTNQSVYNYIYRAIQSLKSFLDV